MTPCLIPRTLSLVPKTAISPNLPSFPATLRSKTCVIYSTKLRKFHLFLCKSPPRKQKSSIENRHQKFQQNWIQTYLPTSTVLHHPAPKSPTSQSVLLNNSPEILKNFIPDNSAPFTSSQILLLQSLPNAPNRCVQYGIH